MKRLFVLITLLPAIALAVPPDWASNDKDRPGPNPGNDPTIVTSSANALAAAAAVSTAEQAQRQAQQQAQGQLQFASGGNAVSEGSTASAVSGPSTSSATAGDSTSSATGGSVGAVSATNAGNTQSITLNEAPELASKTVRSTGTVEVRTVPTAIAPNVYPTASCAMSASVGASALGWGVSGGGTKVNEECMMLEGARMFSQLGYLVQGLTLACSTKSALSVYGDVQKCLDAGTRYATPLPVVDPVVPPKPEPKKVETTIPFGETK